MQIGVFAKTFDGQDPHSVFAACRDAGFATAQYNMACSGLGALPPDIPQAAATRVRDAAAATGMRIAAISATYNMTDPDADSRLAGRAAFDAIAAAAAIMGSDMLTVCSGSLDPHDKWRRHPDNDLAQSWSAMCAEFEILCDCAARHGVLIGVEPEPGNIVGDAEKAARLLATFAGGPIRIIFDPANIIEDVPAARHTQTIEHALDLLGGHIALAHAKDRHEDGSVAPAGKGVIDWPHLLRGLSDAGFDGPLIAHGMSAAEAPGVASFLARQTGGRRR
ncbi:MAG: sugar phosphate isomerase/epimerase [Pseudomonadota bacterium]|nr:sugar phosphate isomerase/epimerase [Pseudomonadota bacterium]